MFMYPLDLLHLTERIHQFWKFGLTVVAKFIEQLYRIHVHLRNLLELLPLKNLLLPN